MPSIEKPDAGNAGLNAESRAGAPPGSGHGGSRRGLSSEAARRLLQQYGPNEPAPRKARSSIAALLGRLRNPLIIILLMAAAVSAFLGEVTNAVIINVMVVLGIVIDFAQTYRSERAVDRLRERVTITATALRDGEWREVPRREIVPGDIVRLSAGDLVPADANLLEALDLHLQEAALTGESLPVSKTPGGAEGSSKVFLGTSVVSGSGIAEVTATGAATQFGGIAAALAAHPEPTAFERGLYDFGMLILRMVVFLVMFVLLAGLAERHPPFESLLFAISLAVGLTPEFLPMITSVTLSQGAIRMARHKVIVKRLAAMQNFGSIDILCSDKTGTITSGKMAVEAAVNAAGDRDDQVLRLAAINSALQTGIRSPLDAAILTKAAGAGVTKPAATGAEPAPSAPGPASLDPGGATVPGAGAQGAVKLGEIPFDFERRLVSVIAEIEGKRLLIAKGAPESLLIALAHADPRTLEQARRTYEGFSARGFRVLAVGSRQVEAKARYTPEDESGLTLAGFVAFSDPPLPGTAATLSALKRDGIQVKIITGDNELVAQQVCAAVGLQNGGCVTGQDVDRLTDTALGNIAERTTIFARVNPAQKTRILLALRRRGHIVGFMGDGINDAPSLRSADVGISVSSAVDVARDAADIILLEPSLRALHAGVLEGRRAFGNVMKYLLMGTSSNFGNMLSMAAASVFLPFLPMLPTQILLNSLLYDLAQVTIPTDRVDSSYMRKPQRWNIRLVRNFMLAIGPISSIYDFLTFFVLLRVFRAAETFFHTGWFVESLATQTLVLFVIRTMHNPFKSRPSPALAATTVGITLLGAALPYTPLAGPLSFVPLPVSFLAFVAAATATYLLLVQLVKRRIFA
jgi:Mg2+-importing ATPase